METQTHVWLVDAKKSDRLGDLGVKRNGKMKMDPEEIELMDIAWFQLA
jgi:hypothetical protein